MGIVIRGGRVFDPESGWHGGQQDLFVEAGRLVSRLDSEDEIIDARGLAVTPGAIDLRSMVAGYGLNLLRLRGGFPTPRELGAAYARLGYTHIHEPWLTWPTAGYVHQELAAIPIVDTSASLTLNLRDFDLWLRDGEKLPEVGAAWSHLLENCRALNLRVVEPFINYRQEFYRHRTMSREAVTAVLFDLMESSGLHLTLEATPELLDLELPVLPGLSLGALGPALVSDAALEKAGALLARGMPADMGLPPPSSRPGEAALPVKIDLDWYNPWDLTVPTPPGASRRALQLALQCRQTQLAFSVAELLPAPRRSFPPWLSWLGGYPCREAPRDQDEPLPPFSLGDWVRATRTLPARFLGLTDRGHLRPGARADLALYGLPADGSTSSWPESCSRCRMLLKAGEVVVRNGEVVNDQVAKAGYYRRTHTPPNQLVADLCQGRSLRPENLWPRHRPDLKWRPVP